MQMNESSDLAIDELVRSHYALVERLALSILDDGSSPDLQDEAEDAVQETFIAAANALESFRKEASLKTWLVAIAVNTCRAKLRRRKARRALANTLLALQRVFMPGEGPEQRVERSERETQLWNAVDELDEKHRLVIILRYVHELSAGEIAQVLEITEGTVHSRLHYARRKLADRLRRSAVFEEVR